MCFSSLILFNLHGYFFFIKRMRSDLCLSPWVQARFSELPGTHLDCWLSGSLLAKHKDMSLSLPLKVNPNRAVNHLGLRIILRKLVWKTKKLATCVLLILTMNLNIKSQPRDTVGSSSLFPRGINLGEVPLLELVAPSCGGPGVKRCKEKVVLFPCLPGFLMVGVSILLLVWLHLLSSGTRAHLFQLQTNTEDQHLSSLF